jgi:signal transduction histidine kinase
MKPRHSLSGKLLVLFLATGLLLILVVRGGFRLAVDGDFRDLAAPHIAEYVGHLLEEIGDPPRPKRAAALAQRLPLAVHILGGGADWSSSGSPPTFQEDRLHAHALPGGGSVLAGRQDGRFLLVARVGDRRVLLVPARWRDGEWIPWAGALTIAGALGVLLLVYHGIRRLFRPLDTIRAGVKRIGAGELGRPIRVRRRDELGELAESVNAMAADIRSLLEAKRQLLLAISHELRSPITRAQVHVALLPEGPNRAALAEDLRRMNRLVEELLESERLNSRHAALNISVADPAELAREVVAAHFPEAGIRMHLEHGAYVALDAPRIRLLIRNLLENALRYTLSGASPPELGLSSDPGGWRLDVTDHGPGIPAEHLPRVTEPFYRGDPSRRRETGGHGLGLHLCQAICEAHGGRLEIDSGDQGTRISCWFPVPPPEPTHRS